MTKRDDEKLLYGAGDLDALAAELDRVGTAFPRRINADPEHVERGLAQLVLTLVELLRQLMERQALRRMETGTLTDEEVERLGAQLSAILEAVGKVAELDLEGVEPTSHPLDLANVSAEDEPRPSLSADEVFANAPDREGNFFRVPPA